MKNLIIIGARGYGRAVYDIAISMDAYLKEFSIKGFLDDKKDALDGYDNYPSIIDSVEDYCIEDDDVFVCALGDVRFKKKYATIIQNKGGVFYNVIHKNAHIGTNARIGTGCIIAQGAYIDCDTCIGDMVSIQNNAMIGHDVKVGDYSMIDCNTFIGGFAELSKNVTIHTGSMICPRVKVGDGSVVNMGSVVIRSVKENKVVMGNPAKELLIPKIN